MGLSVERARCGSPMHKAAEQQHFRQAQGQMSGPQTGAELGELEQASSFLWTSVSSSLTEG